MHVHKIANHLSTCRKARAAAKKGELKAMDAHKDESHAFLQTLVAGLCQQFSTADLAIAMKSDKYRTKEEQPVHADVWKSIRERPLDHPSSLHFLN